MVKKLVSYIAYKLYELGAFESSKRQTKKKLQDLSEKIIFSPDALVKEAIIGYNRDEKYKIRIGKKSTINGELFLFRHGGEIIIGDYCFVGHGSRIWSAKKITIGDRVLISHNVNIHDNVSHPLDSRKRHEDFVHISETGLQSDIDLREEEVIIEDDVWIGFNSTILKGVRIGKGAIIGACSLITEDVPPFSVIVGNPPKIIKQTT